MRSFTQMRAKMRSLLKRGLKVLKRGVTQKKEVGSIELYDIGSSSPETYLK